MSPLVKTLFSIFLLCTLVKPALSQYAPQVGTAGCKAIHKDSSIFSELSFSGVFITELKRGWQNIADTSLGYASVGSKDTFDAKPGNGTLISLGDGGSLILSLQYEVSNHPGADFVVFENGFPFSPDSFFLELAFVEVSADGNRFVRFPAHSLTDSNLQVGPFGSLKAERLYNLAGKYVAPYGTPFDLNELKDSLNSWEINHIKYIRIVDVLGSVQAQYASKDVNGNPINDPWPTPFPSSGFDLSGIGIIHGNWLGMNENTPSQVSVYPNPGRSGEQIILQIEEPIQSFCIQELSGKTVDSGLTQLSASKWGFGSELQPGIYIYSVQTEKGWFSGKASIQP